MKDEIKRSLVEAARQVSQRAYCPYSRFQVGAAVLASNGKIYAGCNVENASYGLTICAERNAIFQMVADGQREIVAIAIYTPTQSSTAPCGACRQVINEFGCECLVIDACENVAAYKENLLNEILPDAFGPKNLNG